MSNNFEEFKVSTYLNDPKSYRGVKVFQVGRYYCTKGRIIEPHLHSDFFELTIVTDGEGIIKTNNIPISVKSGDIYLSLPLDKHEIISSNETPLKYDHIAFYIENAEFYHDMEYVINNFHSASERIINDNKISRLTSLILAEYNNKNDHLDEVISNLLNTIIVYVIRNFKNKEKFSDFENVSSKEILCTQIMKYIDVNIFDIQSLTVISDVLKYNYSYLSSMFKSVTKISLREYFLNRKLEVAKSLVDENKLKIYEIAEKLNYSTPNAFTKTQSTKISH
ncbi:MAG: helix-turn-helix domain-containing protein, partial [Clostridia bacterium]|nr:helix-turn-helix domain-containing protein [Clostridia bacterium]